MVCHFAIKNAKASALKYAILFFFLNFFFRFILPSKKKKKEKIITNRKYDWVMFKIYISIFFFLCDGQSRSRNKYKYKSCNHKILTGQDMAVLVCVCIEGPSGWATMCWTLKLWPSILQHSCRTIKFKFITKEKPQQAQKNGSERKGRNQRCQFSRI